MVHNWVTGLRCDDPAGWAPNGRSNPTAPPAALAPDENWLPVGEGPYSLVMRLYEPGPAVLDGRYAPPVIEEIE